MELWTKIPIPKPEIPIHYGSKLLLLGSCFAENMGDKFHYFQFDRVQNPLGIMFHPIALAQLLQRVSEDKPFSDADLFEHQGLWSCFEAHSSLSSPDKQLVLQRLNAGLHQTRKQLQSASHVFLTLGTAWAYQYLKTQTLVANCHKVPQREFKKQLLSIPTIQEALQQCVVDIKTINPNVQVVFTISPVRHIKDGVVENQRSKAHLIAAVHTLVEDGLATYFPAYELLMDELRDYRFYCEDLVHPNGLAIDYIWERFASAWVSQDAQQTMKEVDAIRKGLAHRPFNPESEQHLRFRASLEQRIAQLQHDFPHMQF